MIFLTNFWLFLLLALFVGICTEFNSLHLLKILQQSGYKPSGVNAFYKNNGKYNRRLIFLSSFIIISICLMLLTKLKIFSFLPSILYALYLYLTREINHKLPLKITNRIKRNLVVIILLSYAISLAISSLIAVFLSFKVDNFIAIYSVFVCYLPLFLYKILPFLALLILKPIEKYNFNKSIKICKVKLQNSKDLIKIGITGSYGKTSVKKILKTILSQKYKVFASPHSYNTPLGICKSVQMLNSSDEIFIAEMGARNVGDIKELCDIVEPDIGILTGVANQHLDTFKSTENILHEKLQLLNCVNLKDNGFMVLSSDNNLLASQNFKDGTKIKFAGVLGQNNFITAKDIKTSINGTLFTISTNDGEFECKTKLIGKHNISNICLAVAVAQRLGLTANQIQKGIEQIEQVSNRMQVIKYGGRVIIDDSYNGNYDGTLACLEFLKELKGQIIIVFQGLVELGHLQYESNYNLAEQMSNVASIVIVVGTANKDSITKGLKNGKAKAILASDMEDVKAILKREYGKNQVIVFLSDLPERYN